MPTERLSMRHIREVLRLHHSVGMFERLSRLQRRVKSAHYHRDSASSKFVAELIGPERRADSRGHPDQVPIGIEIEILESLVRERNVIFGGGEPRH